MDYIIEIDIITWINKKTRNGWVFWHTYISEIIWTIGYRIHHRITHMFR